MPERHILAMVENFIIVGMLSAIGAGIQSLYAHATNKRRLTLAFFVISIILGFFVGNVVGGFLSPDYPYRDGTLLVAGFVSYPLLDIIDRKAAETIAKRVIKE